MVGLPCGLPRLRCRSVSSSTGGPETVFHQPRVAGQCGRKVPSQVKITTMRGHPWCHLSWYPLRCTREDVSVDDQEPLVDRSPLDSSRVPRCLHLHEPRDLSEVRNKLLCTVDQPHGCSWSLIQKRWTTRLRVHQTHRVHLIVLIRQLGLRRISSG